MSVFLILLGVGFLLASLVLSIISIVNETSKTIAIVLLVIGASLVKIGRSVHQNSRKQ